MKEFAKTFSRKQSLKKANVDGADDEGMDDLEFHCRASIRPSGKAHRCCSTQNICIESHERRKPTPLHEYSWKSRSKLSDGPKMNVDYVITDQNRKYLAGSSDCYIYALLYKAHRRSLRRITSSKMVVYFERYRESDTGNRST